VPAGHVTTGIVPVPENAVSLTVAEFIVTFPELVTGNRVR